MKEIINHIDRTIEAEIVGKYYGLAQLVQDDQGAVYPRTIGAEAVKITPNDRYKVLIYHRLIDGAIEDSEEFSFGRYPSRLNAQRIRTVILVDIKKDPEELIIDRIIDLMPEKVLNDSYKYVSISNEMELRRDAHANWDAEWSNAYKDKYQMLYNIYALEYTIDYIKCDNCVDTCPAA